MEKYERNQSPTQLSSCLAPDLEFLILPERVFLLPLRMVTTFGREINKLQKTWAECIDTPTLCDKEFEGEEHMYNIFGKRLVPYY